MRPPAVGAAGGAIGDDSCELYCWDDDDDCEVRLARWRGCMDESVRAPLCTIGGVGRWSQFGVATHCSFGRTSVAHRRSSNPEHGYVDEAYLPIEPSRFRDVGASY